jgi:flagellar biosynthesis protein FliQ
MKKSLKGALLSGLLFPGVGELWLKHPVRGIALLAGVAVSLAVIVTKIGQQALAMLEKMEAEGGAVDLVAIVNLAHATSYDDPTVKIASFALVVCWIVSIIDAYYLGSKKDLADQGRDSNKRAL